MKKKKLLILGTAIVLILALIIGIIIHVGNSNTLTIPTEELNRSLAYNLVTDDSAKIENCDSVQFSAFFTKDLDGDGYAEKYDGTCNEISKSVSLYFDINVLTDGTLTNAKITINGMNFDLKTALVADDVLKNDYIGSNITSLELKDITNGTQKLFSGTISADIGNNINNYSRDDNTIILTGKWVSSDGSDIQDIKKTINLTVDWYGITSTSAYTTNISTTHDISSVIGTEEVTLSFKVAFRETAQQLLIDQQITEVKIPELNEHKPTSVTVSTSNCKYEYDKDTGILTISRKSTVSNDGTITSSVSRINSYSIQVTYPLEAYESLGQDYITLTFTTTGSYYGYNNDSDEFQNPYISSASKSWTHTWREVTTGGTKTSPYFRTYIGKYVYNPDTRSYRYVISKELPLKLYNGLGLDDDDSDEYIVQWYAYSGNAYENQNGFYLEETQEDQFLKSDGYYESLSDYVSTKGIYFSGASGCLGEDGWIKVYDKDGELLIELKGDDLGIYTSSNPYYFTESVSGIKIETSKANENSSLSVYQIKEIDDEAIYEKFLYEEFENLNRIYTYLSGYIYNSSDKTYVSNPSNFAYYEAPVSLASFSISPTTISNQETRTVTMTISTISSRFNEAEWQNGMFVIELPEKILAVEINEVTISDNSVTITSYETYEENGKQYIRIYTSNEEETTYTITIDADITADPRKATSTETVKLYAINEGTPNYRDTSRAEDGLDIDNDSNKTEYVLYKTASLYIVAPSSLLTSQTLSNFDDNDSEVISPQIAILDKSSNDREATINVTITNNYSGTISETIIIGKIPFKGNTYQINGNELGSTYSVTMTNKGIAVPETLQNDVTVYYSENEKVTNDLQDESNNWLIEEQVEDWSKIKTYAIDLSSYTLKRNDTFTFSYNINIPTNVNYNDISYSTHAVYFCLDTEDGKLKTQTEVNRLGIMIAKKFSLNLTKYKNGTDTLVQGATYKVTDGETSRTGTTDVNGNFTISDLYVDKVYTLTEIQSPSSYILNEDEIEFTVTVDDDGKPVLSLTGNTKGTASVTNVDGVFTLNIEVEDEAKYDLKIVKKDSENEEVLKGVKFRITGGSFGDSGRVYTTNENGEITFENLVPGTKYTIEETKAEGYYLYDDIIEFTVTRGENGKLEISSTNTSFESAEISEDEGVDKATVPVELTNEAIPTYSLNIVKQDEEGEYLSGTQFKLTSIDTGEETYLVTGDEGKANLDGLYLYVDGKYITGEYILQEIVATEGYITDTTEIRFKVEVADTDENGIEEGNLKITFINDENEEVEYENYESIVDCTSTDNTIIITIQDDPIFKLIKTGDGEAFLPGAKFAIMRIDDDEEEQDPILDVNDNVIGEYDEDTGYYILTTDENGVFTANLPQGMYKLIEVEAPEGYELPENIEDRTYYVGIGESREEKKNSKQKLIHHLQEVDLLIYMIQ